MVALIFDCCVCQYHVWVGYVARTAEVVYYPFVKYLFLWKYSLIIKGEFTIYKEKLEQFIANDIAEEKKEIGESIIGWYARIKKLAVNCKFGANLASVLQDRFVIGMTKGKIVDRHCEEDPMVKNLQPLVDVAVTKEAAIQLSTTSMVKREVFQLKKKQVPSKEFSQIRPNKQI
ncbi:hypothetical protein QE152_g40391 [Popillia japonica]|uniref:Uncharacterized protein n=1 Tax=Popillia japonica TaxID=7064 RepID=A0AAW1HRI2_POPJA